MTAIEWLTEKLKTEFGIVFSDNILNEAKEIEKELIQNAFHKGIQEGKEIEKFLL